MTSPPRLARMISPPEKTGSVELGPKTPRDTSYPRNARPRTVPLPASIFSEGPGNSTGSSRCRPGRGRWCWGRPGLGVAVEDDRARDVGELRVRMNQGRPGAGDGEVDSVGGGKRAADLGRLGRRERRDRQRAVADLDRLAEREGRAAVGPVGVAGGVDDDRRQQLATLQGLGRGAATTRRIPTRPRLANVRHGQALPIGPGPTRLGRGRDPVARRVRVLHAGWWK